MDRVTSRLASAIADVVEFCRVWDRIFFSLSFFFFFATFAFFSLKL